MKKNISLSLLGLLALSACTGAPQDHVDELVQEKDYAEAIEWLQDELDDKPEDQLINALMAEVIIKKCAAETCFDKAPENLQPLTKHLERVTSDTIQVDDTYFHAYERYLELVDTLMQGKHHPRAITAILNFMPEGNLKDLIVAKVAVRTQEHLQSGDIPASLTLLNTIYRQEKQNTLLSAYAHTLAGMISNNEEQSTKALEELQKADQTRTLPMAIVEATPIAIYRGMVEKSPDNGAQMFVREFRSIIKAMGIQQLQSSDAMRSMANTIYGLSRDEAFIANALTHYKQNPHLLKEETPKTSPTQEITLEEAVTPAQVAPATDDAAFKREQLSLEMLRLAVLLQPENKRAWQTFLTPAIDFIRKTDKDSVNFIFSGIQPADIPADVIPMYNAQLFTLIEEGIQNNENILPFFQRIVLPAEDGDAVKDQARQLLNKAMTTAVDAANYDLIYEYASYQPEVARLSRQKVVSITIDALERRWQNNEFDGMEELSKFLTDTLGIDFSLDSMLLQSFDDTLAKSGVQQQLSADTADRLLLTPEQAKVDLGDKFTYLKKYFKDQPELLDNMLKSLIVKAEGLYGIPTALYSLENYFSDSFGKDDREKYLANALKNSLSKNKTEDIVAFVTEAYALQQNHPELPMNFVVNETVSRLKSLDDSRLVWEKAPTAFKSMIKNTRPQFATLMRAVEAYDKGDHETAAHLFTILTDANFVEQARPYLNEYVNTIEKNIGVYTSTDVDTDAQLFKVEVDLLNALEAPEEDTDGVQKKDDRDLLAVSLAFTNKLGAFRTTSAKDLSVSYGSVVRTVIQGRVNPNTMEITIPDSEKAKVTLPAGFDGLYGNIERIQVANNVLTVHTADNTYTMQREASADVNEVQIPDGRFSFTQTHQITEGPKSLFLPVGSILKIETNTNRPLRTGEAATETRIAPKDDRNAVYTVTGTLMHPSSPTPRTISGFYNAANDLLSISYSYPLPTSGTLDAEVRCQVAGTKIRCGGHNKHWERKKYNDISTGVAIEPPASERSNERKSRSNRPEPGAYKGTNSEPQPEAKTDKADVTADKQVYLDPFDERWFNQAGSNLKLGNGWIF